MATKIVTKNSSTASAVPTASDLVQGELAVNVADKRLFTEDNAGAIVELGTNPSGNVTFQDNGKAIFGAGDDLQIYHDGDSSYISHNTTGTDLVVEATSPGDDVIVRAADDLNFRVNGNENGIVVVGGGATTLYNSNAVKLATTSTGIDVTGTATMDGLTVDGASDLNGNVTIGSSITTLLTGNDIDFQRAGDSYLSQTGGGALNIRTNDGVSNKVRMNLASNGDISFYEDTGTTPKFFWDASAESLGIGNTVASSMDGGANNLVIGSGSGTEGMTIYSGTTNSGTIYFADGASGDDRFRGQINYAHSDNSLNFRTNASSTPDMTIDSAGNLLVGTTDSATTRVSATTGGGHVFQPNDFVVFSRQSTTASQPVVVLNDTGVDGELLEFRKDGASVGSIGTAGGDLTVNAQSLGVLQVGGASKYGWTSSFIYPTNDNTRDLGTSSFRFKDLYLSGDVALGASDGYIFGNTNGVNIRASSGKSTIFDTAGSERMRITSSGNVVIGSTSDARKFQVVGGANASETILAQIRSNFTGANTATTLRFGNSTDSNAVSGTAEITALRTSTSGTTDLFFRTSNGAGVTERMRIDSAGNLLVGTTDTTPGIGDTNAGISMSAANGIIISRANDAPINISRNSSDGDLILFRKDGTVVGSIGTEASALAIGHEDTGIKFAHSLDAVLPFNLSNYSNRDNAIDLGYNTVRFDDIYATNGTIQTSDRNEKQDIEALSDAEQRVAVACKGLLRKFRWKDSVAEKGDEARTHFGIIAQDLQAAFAAEGLDAGDYAMFISTTWTDEETNEEKTRMGVRYSELLAFIISAI